MTTSNPPTQAEQKALREALRKSATVVKPTPTSNTEQEALKIADRIGCLINPVTGKFLKSDLLVIEKALLAAEERGRREGVDIGLEMAAVKSDEISDQHETGYHAELYEKGAHYGANKCADAIRQLKSTGAK